MLEIRMIDINARVSPFPNLIPKNSDGTRMLSAEELIAIYDRLGVEKGVLLPSISPEFRTIYCSNESYAFLAQKYPDRFVWFCSVDPRAAENSPNANLSAIIEHYKSFGARGVGEINASLYIDDAKMENLFSECEKTGMPIYLRIATRLDVCGALDEPDYRRLRVMLAKHPDLIVIAASDAFCLSSSEGADSKNTLPALMREFKNLHCDLSTLRAEAIAKDADYSSKLIEEFADRLYYGCGISLAASTQYLDAALRDMLQHGKISEESYCKIARTNAIRLLKL